MVYPLINDKDNINIMQYTKKYLKKNISIDMIEEIGKYLINNTFKIINDDINFNINTKIELQHLTLPTKTINLAVRLPRTNIYFNYKPVIERIKFNLNGNEFINENKNYFLKKSEGNIYQISFAIEPFKYQPTGTINFSESNKETLWVEINNKEFEKNNNYFDLIVTGENNNILSILSGLGGLNF
jgi:hypothetical protein